MKKFSIATSILGVLFFLLGCEGSFDPSELTPEPDLIIDLIAPPDQQQCLTEGEENGNWRVQFNWSVTPEFEGDFTILLTANGAAGNTQNLNPGDELVLLANTLYTWQIQVDGREEESKIFTFVTPAEPGETTRPPVISTINVEPVGAGHRISLTVLDDDLDEVRLFVNDNPIGGPITAQGNLEWEVNSLSSNAEIRVVATDNSGHSTEQVRRFSN